MIVLDTHAWLWWLHDPHQLGRTGRRLIEQAVASNEVLVSTISIWEVALKVKLGRLALHIDLDTWFAHARQYPGILIVPIDADDAIESTRLPGDFHRDPADQLIVALARRHGVRLITRDRRILGYPHVQAVW